MGVELRGRGCAHGIAVRLWTHPLPNRPLPGRSTRTPTLPLPGGEGAPAVGFFSLVESLLSQWVAANKVIHEDGYSRCSYP
jgi:hypothetical protein